MPKPISDPPAPEIFSTAQARRVGEVLRMVTAERPRFVDIFESPRYGDTQFTRSTFLREVAAVLGKFDAQAAFDAFRESGLIKKTPGEGFGVEDFAPTCRINSSEVVGRGQPVFICTDSPVVDYDARVFPWTDEGEALYGRVTEAWRGGEPRRILDICSGAGTAGLLIGKRWPDTHVVGVDNSVRANLYASFNAQLNGVRRYATERIDLAVEVVPSVFGIDRADIVTIDPPFTAMPPGIAGYVHSTNKAILGRSLRGGLSQVSPGGIAIAVCYAFGTVDAPTELNDILRRLELGEFEVSVELLDHYVWRLNGEKANPLNPMPVQYMATRFYDPDWHQKFIEKGVDFPAYVRWIEDTLVKRKLTHLHYLSVLFRRKT